MDRLIALGMASMKVWVLRDNPYRSFYDRNGGTLLTDEMTVQIGKLDLVHVAYGWTDLTP